MIQGQDMKTPSVYWRYRKIVSQIILKNNSKLSYYSAKNLFYVWPILPKIGKEKSWMLALTNKQTPSLKDEKGPSGMELPFQKEKRKEKSEYPFLPCIIYHKCRPFSVNCPLILGKPKECNTKNKNGHHWTLSSKSIGVTFWLKTQLFIDLAHTPDIINSKDHYLSETLKYVDKETRLQRCYKMLTNNIE